jgi:hypothetical protein
MSRSLQFEALEQRLAMSAGLIQPAFAVPIHGLAPIEGHHGGHSLPGPAEDRAGTSAGLAYPSIAAAAKKSEPIKGTLRGGESSLIPGDYVAMVGSSGKIGNVSFQATMYGQVSGNELEGGSLRLFNSHGVIIADLGPGKLIKSGATEQLKVKFIFEEATGPYAQVGGTAGTATFELKPERSVTKADVPLADDWQANWRALNLALLSGDGLALMLTFLG